MRGLAVVSLALVAGCTGGGGSSNKERPFAQPGVLFTIEDQEVSGTVNGTPVTPGAALVFQLDTLPLRGTATLDSSTGEITYLPDLHAIGTDVMTFVVVENGRTSDPAFVTVSVGLLSASYGSLRALITDTMGVSDGPGLALGCTNSAVCPLSHPIAYLDQYAEFIGDGSGTEVPGPITAVGWSAWVFASTSACAKMASQPSPELFPDGFADFDALFQGLVRRPPTATETATLTTLQASFADEVHKGAAACAAVAATLETVAVN